MCNGKRPIGAAKGTQSDTEALCQPPPPLHKHPPGQDNDGQTRSWCLDRAVPAHNTQPAHNHALPRF